MGRHLSPGGRAAKNVLNNMLVVFWWWLWWCQQATLGATLGDNFESPCPDIFQYQRNSKGELYGTIAVFSFDDDIVQLDVKLSVGNEVDNYHGEVELLSSIREINYDREHSRPILYKVLFPRWENIPPKVTKIAVNNQVVCSEPAIQLGVTSVIEVNLQHTLRLKINPLQASDDDDVIKKLVKSLHLLRQGLQGSNIPSKNPIVIPDFSSIFNQTRTPTFTSTTNKNPYDKNPFFSGGGGGIVFSPSTRKQLDMNTIPTTVFQPQTNPTTFLSKVQPNTTPRFTDSGTAAGGYNKNPFFSGSNFFSSSTQKPSAIDTISTMHVFRPQTNPFLNNTFVSKVPWFTGSGNTGGTSGGDSDGGTRKLINSRPTTGVRLPPVKDTSTSAKLPFSDVCGVTFVPNLLVVNGENVTKGAFPWLAAMFRIKDIGLEYKCSGSLISKKHVVTAAHCVRDGDNKNYRPEEVLFVLGKLNIRRWTTQDGGRMIDARTIHVHKDYKPLESDADVAVVVLNGEITFNNYIKPICLWNEPSDLNLILGQKGKVVGWGKDEHGQVKTEEPKQVTLPVVSQDDCRNSAETFRYITSNRTFCAGSRNGSGPCNGDSGSGFVMKRNGKWFLRGVVSISIFDAEENKCDLSNYVMFTDCTMHKDWLLSFLI